MLVVAADEGVMPQTREHLAILQLLGIERGLVALTKRDLVDDEWAELARNDVRKALERTPLADAPIVEVSATAGVGLGELVATLERVLGETPARRDVGRPRLPVDRAFTMTGFGTVVTGTLLDGELRVGEEIELVPGGTRGRIRGLQTHRRAIDLARPGSRVAVNLAGVEREAAERGMVLTRPGTIAPVTEVALRLAVLAGASDPVSHGEEVKVHLGTAEVMARVSVLEREALAPGAEGWVQLRLHTRVAAVLGDRLVVRRPSPSETLGGGEIADAGALRVRKRADAVAALERRTAPSASSRLLASLDVPRTAVEAGERSGVAPAERDAAVSDLIASGAAIQLGDALVARATFETLATHALRICAQAHRRTPLRSGAPREEVRGAIGLPQKRFAAFIARLAAEGRIAERGATLALPEHEPRPTPEQEAAWRRARAALERDPAHPPAPAQLESEFALDRELIAALAERGDLVRIGIEAVFLPETVVRFADAVIDELASARTITVSRARDLTASSRKHVLPLLQFLDDRGVTRRQGDERILVIDPDAAHARVRALTRHEEDGR
jgi:selenocysteine-specific elongation factor